MKAVDELLPTNHPISTLVNDSECFLEGHLPRLWKGIMGEHGGQVDYANVSVLHLPEVVNKYWQGTIMARLSMTVS